MASATKKGTTGASGQPRLRDSAGHGPSSPRSQKAKQYARQQMHASGRPTPDGR